jgi:hypothetical protein
MSQPTKRYVMQTTTGALCAIAILTFALTETTQRRSLDAVVPQRSALAAAASQSAHQNAISKTAIGGKSFAFGYLEFDWDPSAPGGLPGFDAWPG